MKPERNYSVFILMNLIFILIFSSNILYAQNTKGFVFDEKSKKPLLGVSVFISKTGIGTTTNEKGEFHLKYFSKINENDTLSFTCIGYITRNISFSGLKGSKYVILLSESVELLDGVTVTSLPHLNLQIKYSKLSSLKG